MNLLQLTSFLAVFTKAGQVLSINLGVQVTMGPRWMVFLSAQQGGLAP